METTVKENNLSEDIKEENSEVAGGEYNENLTFAASLFGQSEEDIKREFRGFKAQKLYKRTEYDLIQVTSDKELDEGIDKAKEWGFAAVTVLPQYVVRAKNRLKGTGIEVYAAVNYPFGEELQYTAVKAAKKAVRKGADGIILPAGVALIKRGAFDAVGKQFGKLFKKIGDKKICAAIECGELTEEETKKILRTLAEKGIRRVRTSTGYRSSFAGVAASFVGIKQVAYYSSASEDAVRAFSSAERIASENACDIAKYIKNKFNC
ncbi:MAG: hypothetical protein IJS67_00260 [Clostridia bacterium]|nr:hypothetical protein [Clostridia bacterium]